MEARNKRRNYKNNQRTQTQFSYKLIQYRQQIQLRSNPRNEGVNLTYINNPKYFTNSEIKKNAEKNQFTDLRPVEKFLWDCEIASLLQRKNKKIILKGGTAAQLHLPLELQRASIDIDLVSPLSMNDFEHILDEVTQQENYTYSIYTPKNPEEHIPLKTYLFETPNLLEDEGHQTASK